VAAHLPSLAIQHAQPVSKQVLEWNAVQMQQYCCKQKSKHLYGIELMQVGHEKSLQQWAPAALALPGTSVTPRPTSANVATRRRNPPRFELSVSGLTAGAGSRVFSLTDPPFVGPRASRRSPASPPRRSPLVRLNDCKAIGAEMETRDALRPVPTGEV
jgi:hypothetical protein